MVHGNSYMPVECNEPHLGLATTRELLQEIEARLDVSGHRPTALAFRGMIEAWPPELLDYRTVDDA